MATPTRRPGGPRRPATAAANEDSGLTLEQINALPSVSDGTGERISLNPEESSVGAISNEDVTIASAAFEVVDYGGQYRPMIYLKVGFLREGMERPWNTDFWYVEKEHFMVTDDGAFIERRDPDGRRRPQAKAPAAQFLKSLVNAGLSVEDLEERGAPAIVGLNVHVRNVKDELGSTDEKTKYITLVEHINGDGGTDPKARRQSAEVSSAVAVPATEEVVDEGSVDVATAEESAPAAKAELSDIAVLAQQAILDVLIASDGNRILAAAIPTAVINHPNWKGHEQRVQILQEIHKADFIRNSDAPWQVKGKLLVLSGAE